MSRPSPTSLLMPGPVNLKPTRLSSAVLLEFKAAEAMPESKETIVMPNSQITSVPKLMAKMDTSAGTMKANEPALGLSKKGTNKSIESDCELAFATDYDLNEGIDKASLSIIPMFEIHNSMAQLQHKSEPAQAQELMLAKVSSGASEEKHCEPTTPTRLFKSRSVLPGKKNSLESFENDMSEKELAYLTKLYACKTNYISHTLSTASIFLQYVRVSRADLGFTNTVWFKGEMTILMGQQGKYLRDERRYKGTAKLSNSIDEKTLVLDLDETLAFASSDGVANSDLVFTYTDIEDDTFQVG